MLFSIVLLFVVLMVLEKILDTSSENRIINPMIGFVFTLLIYSRFVRLYGVQTGPLHIVHIVLCIACLLYVRAMIDFLFVVFFSFSE
jgi:hypothetical protein